MILRFVLAIALLLQLAVKTSSDQKLAQELLPRQFDAPYKSYLAQFAQKGRRNVLAGLDLLKSHSGHLMRKVVQNGGASLDISRRQASGRLSDFIKTFSVAVRKVDWGGLSRTLFVNVRRKFAAEKGQRPAAAASWISRLFSSLSKGGSKSKHNSPPWISKRKEPSWLSRIFSSIKSKAANIDGLHKFQVAQQQQRPNLLSHHRVESGWISRLFSQIRRQAGGDLFSTSLAANVGVGIANGLFTGGTSADVGSRLKKLEDRAEAALKKYEDLRKRASAMAAKTGLRSEFCPFFRGPAAITNPTLISPYFVGYVAPQQCKA